MVQKVKDPEIKKNRQKWIAPGSTDLFFMQLIIQLEVDWNTLPLL